MEKKNFKVTRLLRKIVIVFVILISIGVSSLLVPLFQDKDFYSKLLVKKINESISYQVEFSNYYLKVFPSPAIILTNVSVYHPDRKKEKIVRAENLRIKLSWSLLLFSRIKINEILMSDGFINISDSLLAKRIKSDPKSSSVNYSKIIGLINVNEITLNNVHIQYVSEGKTFKIYVSELNMKLEPNYKNFIQFTGKYLGNTVELQSAFKLGQTFQEAFMEGTLTLPYLSLKEFKPYLKIFDKADFSKAYIEGTFNFKKSAYSKFTIEANAKLNRFADIWGEVYPTINVVSSMDWDPKNDTITFYSIQANSQKIATNGQVKGEVNYEKDVIIKLDVYADYVSLEPLIRLIIAFASLDIPTTKQDVYVDVKFQSKSVSYSNYMLSKCGGSVYVKNRELSLDVDHAEIFSGSFSGIGKITFYRDVKYNFDISVFDMDVNKVISSFTSKKYITGKLNSRFTLNSFGIDENHFLKNLKLNGNLKVAEGELMGQADILKPIFALGKVVNILGPRGNYTGFQSIRSDYKVSNQIVYIQSVKMKGVGLDAEGEGTISFGKKIDLRIVVGLGGIAGKLIKVPIVSKGTFPDYNFYVDPIWLGTVYVAGFFGGPAGAAASSAASEYVNKAWKGVKSVIKENVWDKIKNVKDTFKQKE
ncbi:MAG: hypothetical protein H7A23_11345 [Leptospiraceae bacterium]|nr:hypothetical protein [Leptospiraceae bacterium]MCP5495140.1 hypothetical protein [Leptospiraceae bacterium]